MLKHKSLILKHRVEDQILRCRKLHSLRLVFKWLHNRWNSTYAIKALYNSASRAAHVWINLKTLLRNLSARQNIVSCSNEETKSENHRFAGKKPLLSSLILWRFYSGCKYVALFAKMFLSRLLGRSQYFLMKKSLGMFSFWCS